MVELLPDEIAQYYAIRIPSLKQNQSREWRGPCPVHSGKEDNFSVNPATGFAHCHSQCQTGWDVIGLERVLTGSDFIKAKAAVWHTIGRETESYEERDIEATYDYTNEAGELLYQVVRKLGKKFMVRRPVAGAWAWGLGEHTPIPYLLHKWHEAKYVVITEGEKDARTLDLLGIKTTTNTFGAGKFKPELSEWFRGKKVYIFADNDEPGRAHALQVAAILQPVALYVRVIEIPDAKPKGDVTDFIRGGGTTAQVLELMEKAQNWTPEWQFSSQIPDENDKFLRTLEQTIAEVGGINRFWDMRTVMGIPTPWVKLDKSMAGGLRKGEVYVIGGNQGSGKTSLLLQFIMAAMYHHAVPLLFSMEMLHITVFQRMCSIAARVDLLEFMHLQLRESIPHGKKNSLDEEEREKIKAMRAGLIKATGELQKYPLTVSTKARVTPEYLLAETLRLKKRQDISYVAIDHMQLMGSTGSVKGDYEKFTAISRMTKEVATTLQVPVVIVSQTSRANGQRKGNELEVSDLRGSGAIEEDAAGILLIYPDDDDERDNKDFAKKCRSWMKKGKDRFGVTGSSIEMVHDKTCTRFDLGGARDDDDDTHANTWNNVTSIKAPHTNGLPKLPDVRLPYNAD